MIRALGPTLAAACGTAAIAVASLVAVATPSRADTMTAKIDCSAETKMVAAMEKGAMMAPSGDVDKDFTAMSAANAKMMAAMARVEMTCGKDAKTRAMAKRAESVDLTLLRTLGIGTGATH